MWKFCIIDPLPGAEIEVWDNLEILTGDDTYANLTVVRFDSGKAIANYGSNKWNRNLFPGELVYSWQDIIE